MALSDDRVDDATKVMMVENLGNPNKQTGDDETPDLASCVTMRAAALFNLLQDVGKEFVKEGFLKQPRSMLSQDPTFLELRAAASGLSCVNDAAEWRVVPRGGTPTADP